MGTLLTANQPLIRFDSGALLHCADVVYGLHARAPLWRIRFESGHPHQRRLSSGVERHASNVNVSGSSPLACSTVS